MLLQICKNWPKRNRVKTAQSHKLSDLHRIAFNLSAMSRTSRLLAILDAHLRTPALTSLVLLPLLPTAQTNLIFELVPAYQSCKALLARPNSARRHAQLAQLQQWLAYWLIYALVRLLELSRFRLDSLREMQHVARVLPRFLYNLIRLPSSTASLRAASAGVPPARTQTLATQLAGTPLRWTMFKCILLFYAMDVKLQGARWILEKIAKPVAGFFTGLEEGIEEAARSGKRSLDRGLQRAEEAVAGDEHDTLQEEVCGLPFPSQIRAALIITMRNSIFSALIDAAPRQT